MSEFTVYFTTVASAPTIRVEAEDEATRPVIGP